MVFERPLLLVLFPLAIFLLWLAQRGSLTTGARQRRRVSFLLRAFIVALVILAVARPLWLSPNAEPAVVFVRDVSASLDQPTLEAGAGFVSQAREGKEGRSAEVVFAAEALVSKPFGQPTSEPAPDPARTRTDLTSALEFATALLPADRPGRLVLLTDGQSNQGRDVESILPDLKQRQIQVDVVPLRRAARPDAAVTGIEAPAQVQQNEVYDLKVAIHSTTPIDGARVRLYQNNLLLAEQAASLREGTNQIIFPRLKADGTLALYEAQVISENDDIPENDRAAVTVLHEVPARALIIDGRPEQSEPLAGVLRMGGLEVEIRPASGLPATLDELQNFQLVVVADAAAADFSTGQLDTLQTWVRDFGGGFLMLGGENSFGAGGYSQSPLANILPVTMEKTLRDESPVVALLIILDRSGSMTTAVAGRTKMSLANDGAALAFNVLQSKDIFGVYAVDTRVQQAVPLGPVDNAATILSRIAGITSGGGGIYTYTALAEALPAMRKVEARIKHVILFSDAADAEEKIALSSGATALDLASALLASHITLSVVALGTEQDPDTGFLRELASKGGGRFYLTSDATSLPRLFAQETLRVTQSSIAEEPFLVQPVGSSEVTKGLNWTEAPPLLGQNLATLKQGANLLLANEKGQPVLAEWRIGSGRVAAFTSDARDRWAAEWLGWDGYGKFWSQVARLIVRPEKKVDLAVDALREQDGRLVVEISAVAPDGAFRNSLPVTVTLAEEGQTQSETARQTGPGRYEVSLPAPKADTAMLAISEGSGFPVSAAWTRPRNVEYLPAPDGRPRLEKIALATDGLVDLRPDQVFRPSSISRPSRRDLSGWALLLAALLWVMDVWLRRRDWPVAGKIAS